MFFSAVKTNGDNQETSYDEQPQSYDIVRRPASFSIATSNGVTLARMIKPLASQSYHRNGFK